MQMVRAESTNTCTADIDTNHMFALLVELNVMYAQTWVGYSSKCKIVTAELLRFLAKCTPI